MKGKKHPVLSIPSNGNCMRASSWVHWSCDLQGWGVLLGAATSLAEISIQPAKEKSWRAPDLNVGSMAACTAQQPSLAGCFWKTLPANVRKIDPKQAFSGKHLGMQKLHSSHGAAALHPAGDVEQMHPSPGPCANHIWEQRGNTARVGSQG